MSILIQNGTLICPEGPVQAGLRVDGGKIVEIGPALPVLQRPLLLSCRHSPESFPSPAPCRLS